MMIFFLVGRATLLLLSYFGFWSVEATLRRRMGFLRQKLLLAPAQAAAAAASAAGSGSGSNTPSEKYVPMIQILCRLN